MTRPKDTHFLFVDNIRFLSMAAIITLHTRLFGYDFLICPGEIAFAQIFKFGTICFYIIAGFLLGTRIETEDPRTYYRRRLRNTFVPWLFWSGAFVAYLAVSAAMRGPLSFAAAVDLVRTTLFFTNYWFVPNFLLALAILLLFRRWLGSARFGLALLACSAVYAVNLYASWFPTAHTCAVFGFVFYLWLGYFVCRHHRRVQAIVDRLPWPLCLAALALCFGASVFEAKVLSARSGDWFNTLRISNQLYSVAVFFMLFKVRRRMSPRWMDVRKYTFGLYLIHWLAMNLWASLIFAIGSRMAGTTPADFNSRGLTLVPNPFERIALWALLFCLTYGSSMLVTVAFSRTPLSGFVGNSKKPERTGEATR